MRVSAPSAVASTTCQPDMSNVFLRYTVTAADVAKLIRAAPLTMSLLDLIPASVFKEFSQKISAMVAPVTNLSFSAARFTSTMKQGWGGRYTNPEEAAS